MSSLFAWALFIYASAIFGASSRAFVKQAIASRYSRELFFSSPREMYARAESLFASGRCVPADTNISVAKKFLWFPEVMENIKARQSARKNPVDLYVLSR